jgi:oxazoline/thiazoline synthase
VSGALVATPPVVTGQRVGFRRHLRAEVVSGDATYLFSERGVTALTGSQVEALAPLLDGTRDLAGVLRDMPAGTSAAQVETLVARLVEAGLVTHWSQPGTGAQDGTLAYWDAARIDPVAAVARVATARVALICTGRTGSAAAEAALAGAGLSVSNGPDESADLSVVLCEDYLEPALAGIDAAHRAAGRPWLLAKPGGATVWIGPVFQPPGACWHCLAVRLRAHRNAEVYVQTALGRSGPVARNAVSVPPLACAAGQLVTLETIKWLAGFRHRGQQCVWTLDSLDLHGRQHELRARPQCPHCGDPALVASAARRPVVLQQRRKLSCSGGGHRSEPPERVLQRYRHLISPVTGLVKEVERDRRGPEFFNVYRSGPNLALGARNLRGLTAALRVENGGKGTTPLQAEVSALCEALERHSGVFAGDEERVRGSLRSLGADAIHPNECLLFDERQFATRAAWNAAHGPFQHVYARFDPAAELDWTPVWSVSRNRHRFLPTTMLYYGAPATLRPVFCYADSNGNAAGSSLEDAVLQGLLELVERDAVALWWYNRTSAPGVDLDAFGEPWVDEMREVYAGLDREVWVLDVTSDLQIPAMVALSRRTAGDAEGIMFGFGSHQDPTVALLRALTELNQLMPAAVRSGRNGQFGCDDDPDAAHWLRYACVANQPYLVPDPAVRPRRPQDYRYLPCPDLAGDIAVIRTRLEALGLEMLVLDQTRPDIGLPVVKVIVPGLRHFWARFGPGRLFDVPVRLGRLKKPTPYDRLNPVPLFA